MGWGRAPFGIQWLRVDWPRTLLGRLLNAVAAQVSTVAHVRRHRRVRYEQWRVRGRRVHGLFQPRKDGACALVLPLPVRPASADPQALHSRTCARTSTSARLTTATAAQPGTSAARTIGLQPRLAQNAASRSSTLVREPTDCSPDCSIWRHSRATLPAGPSADTARALSFAVGFRVLGRGCALGRGQLDDVRQPV